MSVKTGQAHSMQGNAHVHWHVAPLPPGVPYERQQYHALMAENGVLPYAPQELAELAARIRAVLATFERTARFLPGAPT